jgi:O-antigen/teichoic acid export membrane protein
VLYGVTGLGFMGANLLLARHLDPTGYATISLIVAVMGVAVPLGPLGMDGVVNRLLLGASRPLLALSIGLSLGVGLASATLASAAYGFSHQLGILLFLSVAAGGTAMVAAAVYQRYQRLTVSLLLAQNANLSLLAGAVLMVVFGWHDPLIPIVVLASGYLAAAVLGWGSLHPRAGGLPEAPIWRDAMHYAGVAGSGLLLLQLERLVIPGVLSLVDLATFGVVAAIVLAPFRILQMGVSFAILPKLRAATSVRERRRLLGSELMQVGAIAVVGVLGVLVVARPLLNLLLGEKYHFPQSLIVAAAVGGVVRVLGGFSRGVATALCTTRQLALFNVIGWLSVVVATTGAAVGSRWGLVGLIYGTSVGWMVRVGGAALLARRQFRQELRDLSVSLKVGADGAESAGPPV